MRPNEQTTSARRIGPLCAELDGDPVVGEDFSGAGELEISIDGEAFRAGAGELGEIGDGFYFYEVPFGEEGELWIAVKLAGVCDPFTFRENMERTTPSGIVVGQSVAARRRVGPLLAVDEDGNDLGSLAGVTVQVSINGSPWATGAGALAFTDDGHLYYAASPTEVRRRGWIAVKLGGTAGRFCFREDIIPRSPID